MTTNTVPSQPADSLWAERARFRAYLVARVGHEAEADDFLQNSLLKAMRSVGEVHDEARLTEWFFKVLRRAVVEHVRSRPSAAARERAWHAATAASPATDEHAINRCIEALIATLKPRHAALLHLIELDGTSVWTAATALGITANSAWVTLHRARTQLRAKLESFCRECVQEPWADCAKSA